MIVNIYFIIQYPIELPNLGQPCNKHKIKIYICSVDKQIKHWMLAHLRFNSMKPTNEFILFYI